MGNAFELAGCIDKFLPNPIGKLDCLDEVSDAEAKAHRDLEQSAVIA